jgi:hypothetical protein
MAKAALKVGSTTIDPAKTYKITLAKAIPFGGIWLRPSDKTIRVSGEALATILETEGVVIDATEI